MMLVAVVCSVAGTSPCFYLVVLAAAHTACACMGVPCGRLAPAGTLACVSWCGVPFFVFPCVALCLGGLSPLMLSHTLLVSWRPRPMRAGIIAGLLSRWWWRGRCALCLVRCAPRLPFVAWQRGVSYNILVLAARMFLWRLPYFVLLFCFSCWCWGAHKSPAPTACTLLSVLGHATFSFPVLAALVFVVFQ